jgi:hypothetical protein
MPGGQARVPRCSYEHRSHLPSLAAIIRRHEGRSDAARKEKARVDEIHAAFTILRRELADYARRHGGRFIVYGSAASGRFHFESDIDILVDFDDEAWGLHWILWSASARGSA